ncbi:hypothetical protein D9M72_579850 [compost metagenome]
MFRKPGPAMSTAETPSMVASRVLRTVANSRGLTPACLDSWRAMFVAQSPWSRFFGRSTRTSSGTADAERVISPAATASFRQADMARESSSGVTRLAYRWPAKAAESGQRHDADSAHRKAWAWSQAEPLR